MAWDSYDIGNRDRRVKASVPTGAGIEIHRSKKPNERDDRLQMAWLGRSQRMVSEPSV